MNELYRSVEKSKQAFHQWMDRKNVILSANNQLLILIHQIREDHPTMGARDMYYKINPEHLGRDTFELFCKEEGLSSKLKKNFCKTTDSSGVVRFDNLLVDLEINNINQVWQSDITYFEVNERFYYITFIVDSFTRRIIGHQVSCRLLTEHTTLPALKMAVAARKKEGLSVHGLIFHSDGGGQYYDKEFLKYTAKNQMINSMCECAWENGKAERVNGVVKNNYLIHRNIKTFEELKREVDRSVRLYNNDKPHIGLQRKSPIEFEKSYLCFGQQTDGEKSATEFKSQREHITTLRSVDNKPRALISLQN